MDYEVTYHPEQKKRYPTDKKPVRSTWVYVGMVLLAGALIVKLWGPRLSREIQTYRETYDLEILSEHLRQGESIGDSVTAFCLNALEHAENS